MGGGRRLHWSCRVCSCTWAGDDVFTRRAFHSSHPLLTPPPGVGWPGRRVAREAGGLGVTWPGSWVAREPGGPGVGWPGSRTHATQFAGCQSAQQRQMRVRLRDQGLGTLGEYPRILPPTGDPVTTPRAITSFRERGEGALSLWDFAPDSVVERTLLRPSGPPRPCAWLWALLTWRVPCRLPATLRVQHCGFIVLVLWAAGPWDRGQATAG